MFEKNYFPMQIEDHFMRKHSIILKRKKKTQKNKEKVNKKLEYFQKI